MGSSARGFAARNDRLRRAREERSWTQAHVAKAVGTSTETVSRWELGRQAPIPFFREKLCTLFEAGPQELGLIADAPAEPAAVPAAVTGAAPAPRELPRAPADFTGRTGEVAALRELLGAGGASPVVISAIDGMGGVGKSALAIHVAHQLAGVFPDGQLYVDLQGATAGLAPLDPLDALGRMLRSLGGEPAPVPGGVEEAAARFRSLAAGRRLLILLDNARCAEQVRPLLPGSLTCGVLVTSRQVLGTLEGVRPLHLDVLPADQALELLGRIAGPGRIAAERAAATDVVRRCGELPLAVRLAGARLAARPAWPVRELSAHLADAAHRLEALSAGEMAVRASFDVSLFALREGADATDRAAAAAFGLLSLLDGPDFGAAAAARLLGVADVAAVAVLERLVDVQLLETPRPGRYRFHDLLRLYAREHAAREHPEPERAAALTRATAHYAATAWHTLALLRPGDRRLATADPRWTAGGLEFDGATAALDWLEAERANMLAVIAQAADGSAVPGELAGQLARALFGFSAARNYWHDWAWANETALDVARRTGDRAGAANAQNDLGIALERLGRYAESIACQQESLAILRELGDRRGQAVSLNNLSLAYERLGRHAESVACKEESLDIFRALGDRRGQSLTLNNLGIEYARRGRSDEAVACLLESLAISRELADRLSEAGSLHSLGGVYGRLGRHEEAIAQLLRCLDICRALGDRQGEAASLNDLGVVHRAQGRHEEAIARLREGLEILRELGSRQGQADVLRDLGDALLAAGHRDQAAAAWTEGLAISEALETPQSEELRDRLASLGGG